MPYIITKGGNNYSKKNLHFITTHTKSSKPSKEISIESSATYKSKGR